MKLRKFKGQWILFFTMSVMLLSVGCSKESSEPVSQWDDTYQKVEFFDAFCEELRPVPVTFSIPSNYAIRHLDMGYGFCLWAAEKDLDSVFASRTGDEIDLSKREGGLFQARVSMNVDYDVRTKKFTNEDDFAMQLKSVGMEGEVKRLQYGGCPAMLIEAHTGPEAADNMNDTYMLYVAFPHLGYSVLINYRPSKAQGEQDKHIWDHFVENIETTITVEDTNVSADHNDRSTYLDMMKSSRSFE